MMKTTAAAAKTRVSRELWAQAAPHAFRSLFHPFVAGLAAGTLPTAAFRAFLLQDAYYLTGFAKVREARALGREGGGGLMNEDDVGDVDRRRTRTR